MGLFSRLFGTTGSHTAARGPAGHRAYAVGDVHGRLDLLDHLLSQIEVDISRRRVAKNFVVFLGDLIDRGPHSAQVIERLRTWQPDGITPVFLSGNHEEVLSRVLAGERGILGDWLRFGGAECLTSYGLSPSVVSKYGEAGALAMIQAFLPTDHRDFLATFADTFRFGDYLFVHAGIRPGVELAAQRQKDLRWIRGDFLENEEDHGFVVVHGHTISAGVDERLNRIGVDTGAYQSGILTAIAIEGSDRWFFDTANLGAAE